MKILNNSVVTSDTVMTAPGAGANSSFPIGNLVDVNQAKVCKPEPVSLIEATITVDLDYTWPEPSAFFVGNTNAHTIDWSVLVTGTSPTQPTITSGSWEAFNSIYEVELNEAFEPMSTMLVELSGHSVPTDGKITVTLVFNDSLTGAANEPPPLEVGIIQGGWIKSFSDLEHGLTESLRDNNIYRRLADGSEYAKERIPSRVHRGTTKIHVGEMGIFKKYAKQFRVAPTVLSMVDIERRSLLFGKFSTSYNASRQFPEYFNVQITAEEQL